MGPAALKEEITQLMIALHQKGLKFGVKKCYAETFDRLHKNLLHVQGITSEIQSMLAGTFRQLNAEYGFSLQAPAEPPLTAHFHDLEVVQRSHVQYLGISNAFRLTQPEFTDRLVRALSTRLRSIHEAALADIELWSKSAAAQLDAQLRERRRTFGRRLDAIDRIQLASGGLGDRIAEILAQGKSLNQLDAKLFELTEYLAAGVDTSKFESTALSELV